MTGKLSEKQLTWLRGLHFANGFVLMSASEMGDPEVSELQSRGLVSISGLLDGKNWRILPAGIEAAGLTHT